MIRIVNNLDELLAIKQSWNDLTEGSTLPILSFDWFYNCAKHLYDSGDIQVMLYYENDVLKCILPLARVKHGFVATYEILGSSFLYEPSSFIADRDEYFISLLESAKTLKHPVSLRRIPGRFSGLKLRSMYALERRSTSSSYIYTGTDWESYYASLKSRRRSDHRRALRKAAIHGTVRTDILQPTATEFEPLFQDAMQIESSGWKGVRKSALLLNENTQNFFRAYLVEMCRRGLVRIAFLSISDKRIAMSICIVENSQCCVLKIGYIEEYSDCSPSMLLAMETIKYAFEQQLASYEFLGSYESWQDMWTIGIRNYATVTLYPYSINSLLHLGTDFGRFLMRRMAPRSLYTGGTAGPQR